MDTMEVSGQTYEIYSAEEADERGISYVYWKDASEAGQWVSTDDGYVCQVRKIYGPYPPGDNRMIALGGGMGWDTETYEIHWEEFKKAGHVSSLKPNRSWVERELDTRRSKEVIDIYSRLRAQGVQHSKMPWEKLGNLYRPDHKRPDWAVQRYFKNETVMKKISKRISEILADQGLSDEDIINEYKWLVSKAKAEGDLTNVRLTLDSIAKMAGIDKPKESQRLLEETVSLQREIGEGIKKEKQKIQASRKQEFEEVEVEEDEI